MILFMIFDISYIYKYLLQKPMDPDTIQQLIDRNKELEAELN